jgi:HAMP domain-containing protein
LSTGYNARDLWGLHVKLLAKFNLMLIVLFGLGLLGISGLAHRFLLDNARKQTLVEAELMVSSARSMRDYTEEEVGPLLEHTPEARERFLPQTIPFYAATVTFNRLRKQYPDYTYKEATLNPTNLTDRASDWEADVIQDFRNHADKTQIVGQRDTATGGALFLAHPIRAEQGCLECHGLPAQAPPTILKKYGSANGFGWNLGEVVGAQIVSVPTSVPLRVAENAFKTLLGYLVGVFVLALGVIDLGLYFIVILPLRRLSHSADLVSKGDMNQPEFRHKGRDEISEVTASFNRMYVSLQKAFQLLDDQS